MDELSSIKSLSRTQNMIRDALKTLPALNIPKPDIVDDFVVFDDQKSGNKTISLYDRFLSHKNNRSLDESQSHIPGQKWSQLKNNMTQELEIKRMEKLKELEIKNRIENEEIVEEVDEEVDQLADELVDINEDVVDNNADNDTGSDCDEELEDEEIVDSEVEDIERESNPFIDNEAEDEDNEGMEESDDDMKETEDNCGQTVDNDTRSQQNCVNLLKDLNGSQSDEECDDNDLNNSFLNTSVNSLDESERRYASQKIALSPFMSQRIKSRLPSNQKISELVSKMNTNSEFDSQTLLDLCSGNFTEIGFENNSKNTENVFQTHEEEEEDQEVLTRSIKVGKIFNIESDNESDEEEEEEVVLKQNSETVLRNGSEGEEFIISEAEESEEFDGDEEVDENIENIGKTFFDNEAELSGSDEVSSDEEEDEEDDQELDGVPEEDIPSDSEIKDQIGRYHNKQLLDEDKRDVLIWKERLFADGDLHDDGRAREKKFRWNFEANDEFVNDYINEDSDDNYFVSDDENETKTPELKMFGKSSDNETNGRHLDQLKSKFKTNISLKTANRLFIGRETKKGVNLNDFVVRDERLKTIMSTKRSINTTGCHSLRPNKKLKNCTKNMTKPSVFDLI